MKRGFVGKTFFGVVPAFLCCSAHAETDVLLMGADRC
jgi:hypothetical protein